MTAEPEDPGRPDDLNDSLPSDRGAHGRFDARVSAAYRDAYYQSVPGSNGGSAGIPYQGKTETTTIDASASYNLTDNLSLSIEGLNLTDEFNRQNHGDLGGARDSTYVYHHTGRQVYLGARYRF